MKKFNRFNGIETEKKSPHFHSCFQIASGALGIHKISLYSVELWRIN